MPLIRVILSIVLSVLILSSSIPPSLAATLPPNENLVVEGIPEIPLSLVERVNRYTEFRGAGLSSWHPTRREMLISTRFCNTSQIHAVKSPLGARRQLTFFSEPPSGASYQPTKGDYFVFSRDVGGNEFNQNYRYDGASGDITLLTDGKSRNSRGIWSSAGDRMAYTSTRRTGKDNDIYIIDPRNPASDRLLATVEGGGWSPLDWSPDDRQLLVGEFVSVNESYLWLFDLATGNKTLLTPKGGKEPVSYGGAAFSKDGKGLYLVSDRESEFQRLAYYDFASKRYTYLSSSIRWDVEDFDLSEDGKLLAFVTNEDGISVLHLLDTRTRREKQLPKLPTGLIFRLNWHPNSKELGFSLVSARSTADVYSLDIASNRVERWTESEGGIDPTTFSEPELVRWKSFDGKTISGFLYRPPATFSGKRPVIIDIHGGPESQSRPVFQGRDNFLLNELGVALLLPNVRGSSGYGKTFLKLDNGYLREDAVKDIGALLDWIGKQPGLDADRILVTGGSYGGYMSLAAATTYSDRIRAAINIVGISNFVTFLERTEGYRRDLRRVEYGDERDPKMREFLTRISPLTNADKIQKPLFVVHGKNDPRVPLNEAEQIVATVRKSNVPVWYLMAKNEGHGFAKKENVDFEFYATVLFIQKFLLQ
jgi:dipeptidyl aminopeptidase/acylaminoacyl peptidase